MGRHDREITGLESKIADDTETIRVLDDIIQGKMTIWEAKQDLQTGINERETRIDLLKKNASKIFYPDPQNDNDCAQCGKPRKEHHQSNTSRYIKDGEGSGPFFCN